MTTEEFDNFVALVVDKCTMLSLEQLTEVEMAVWILVKERLCEQGFEEH